MEDWLNTGLIKWLAVGNLTTFCQIKHACQMLSLELIKFCFKKFMVICSLKYNFSF